MAAANSSLLNTGLAFMNLVARSCSSVAMVISDPAARLPGFRFQCTTRDREFREMFWTERRTAALAKRFARGERQSALIRDSQPQQEPDEAPCERPNDHQGDGKAGLLLHQR